MRIPFRRTAVPTPAVLAGRTPTVPPLPVPPTAVAAPVLPPAVPAAVRSTYRVHFDGAIPDLIIRQATRAELAATVVGHVRPYVRADRAVIDSEMPFILVRAADHTVARATFTVLPTGGAR